MVLFACCALLMYFVRTEKAVSVVQTESEHRPLVVVLKDEHDFLIPLTISSSCSDEIGCLNEALSFMSQSSMGLFSVLPHHAQIQSILCEEGCVIDFTKEILEFMPSKKDQIEQVLSVVLNQYDNVILTVEGKPSPLRLKSDTILNPVRLVDQDYSKGYLYQMYMMKEVMNEQLLVPVAIYAPTADSISVIEQFYSMQVSVQFDNIDYATIQLEQADPWRLNLVVKDAENLKDSASVMAVLHSIKKHTDAKSVELIINDVVVQQFELDELPFNQIHLSDEGNIVYNINGD